MNAQRLEWFAVEDLAEEWKCGQSRVERLIQTGQIAESARFTRKGYPDEWVKLPYTGSFDSQINLEARFSPAPAPAEVGWDKLIQETWKDSPRESDVLLAEELVNIIKAKKAKTKAPKDFQGLVCMISNKCGWSYDRNYIKLEDVEAFERGNATLPDPTKQQEEQSPDSQNYFILEGDYWRVQFNGEEKRIIKDSVNIRTLVEYLQNPWKEIDKIELYKCLHSSGEQENTPESPIERISDSDKVTYGKAFKELLDQYPRSNVVIGIEKQEESDQKLTQFCDHLQREYGATCERDTGKILWPKILIERNSYIRNIELVNKQIKRALNMIVGKKMTELSTHLEKFLKIKDSIYDPPDDFPEWHTTY